MSTGRLRISVFDNTIGKPAPNSTIRISQSNQPEKIIEELITNESGQSDTIVLNTPPVDYSLNPDSPMPYTEYNIDVTNSQLGTVSIKNMQILPDVIAEQNVFFTKPLNTESSQNFVIPPHTLYGEYPPKIAEDDVKELPRSTGFVVLDDVVVPEFIVVHDGVPDDTSAPDYWIPYKDYIKNVASCEIYATWPEECIKANVLAIISFTLNRVYTEWYRSRGKNFTVTSSTAYDQKFVYQRNFFQEISRVVDDIFTNYITKPNIKQPLFTQYCDGKNVTCPEWLSQWGSKYLAENGNGYLDILRNYYGTEIYLDSATQVTGIPVSFPGTELQSGSTGEAVRIVQRQLNSISNNYPLINKVAVDGVFGQNTVDSVKKFQEIFGLSQTGTVDYATWYEMSKVFTAVERLA